MTTNLVSTAIKSAREQSRPTTPKQCRIYFPQSMKLAHVPLKDLQSGNES